ncbi:hypothetical protein L7F22_046919 [Adiantum nelumboides]|nr:hypothetical protein [Adiantum nelumboides]
MSTRLITVELPRGRPEGRIAWSSWPPSPEAQKAQRMTLSAKPQKLKCARFSTSRARQKVAMPNGRQYWYAKSYQERKGDLGRWEEDESGRERPELRGCSWDGVLAVQALDLSPVASMPLLLDLRRRGGHHTCVLEREISSTAREKLASQGRLCLGGWGKGGEQDIFPYNLGAATFCSPFQFWVALQQRCAGFVKYCRRVDVGLIRTRRRGMMFEGTEVTKTGYGNVEKGEQNVAGQGHSEGND